MFSPAILLGGGRLDDPLFKPWRTAVGASGGVFANSPKPYNTLLKGIRAFGLLPKIDCLWVYTAGTPAYPQPSLVDLVGRRVSTPFNSPTLVANQGYSGDGSSSGIDAGWIAGTHGVAWTLASAHLVIYDRTARTDAAAVRACGPYDGGGAYAGIHTRRISTCAAALNDTSAVAGAVADASGIWLANRLAGQLTLFRDAVSVATGAVATTGLVSTSLYVGCFNNNGTPAEFTTDQIALVGAGGGFTTAEAATYTSLLRACMNEVMA